MWRGRKLQFPEAEGLRPTGDRIRETLFNWLQPSISSARCLDVFAGSGALGFEALSRGAASATLLEANPGAVAALQQNRHLLAADNAIVIKTDALSWLDKNPERQSFDIVFLDPPFASDLLMPAIERLESNAWLAENALIYIETAASDAMLSPPPGWHLLKDKTGGDVAFRLYRRD